MTSDQRRGVARVESVNVAQPTTLQVGPRATVTGIRKRPQPGRVAVDVGGLAGDHVMNRRHHGGPDQAVYLYTRPDLDFWAERLGETPPDGAFGENLRISAWDSADLRVGDRLAFAGPDAMPGPLLEVTAPRIPCATLAAQMNDSAFARIFQRARRPGAYLRVLRPGTLGAGDPMTLEPGPAGAPTLGELFDLATDRAPDAAWLRSLLAFPLAARLRRDVEQRLGDRG